MVYSSASDVKSFHVCFYYGIVLAEFIPGLPLPLSLVSIRKYLCFHCSYSVTVPGGLPLIGLSWIPFALG